MADYLKKGSKILLVKSDTLRNFCYIIVDRIGTSNESRLGATKEVYIATKVNYTSDGKPASFTKVILKEFYPKHIHGIKEHEVTRDSSGEVHLDDSSNNPDSPLGRALFNFKREVSILSNYKNLLSVPDKVCLLEGNGTYYIENSFLENASTWDVIIEKNKLSMDEILQTAVAVYKSLNVIHLNSEALVDFKPSDILLTYDAVTQSYNLDNPIFFDMGSILKIDTEYPISDVYYDAKYAPAYFSKESKVTINRQTEQATFLKMLLVMFAGCKGTVSQKIYTELIEFINPNNPENIKRTEEDTMDGLTRLKEKIQQEEYDFKSKKIYRQEATLRILRVVVTILVSIVYLTMGFLLTYSSSYAEKVNAYILENNISATYIAVILAVATTLIFALRLFVDIISERIARVHTSVLYFDKKDKDGNLMRTGDFNTFRHGWRGSTTFQDISNHNQKRQRYRRILFAILFIAIISCLALSVKLNAFPVFLALGCLSVIVFMYAELFPSTNDFFESCRFGCPNGREKNLKPNMRRADYFLPEYERTNAFDLNSPYYKENFRNLLTIKEDINTALKSNENFNIGFLPFQMRHIYRQSFDRLRNVQIITNISTYIIMLTTVFVDYMAFMGKISSYFMIPSELLKYITPALTIAIMFVSLYNILHSLSHEITVAEMAYKSRYINDKSLNKLIVEDIAKGTVESVDIVRGLNEAEAEVNTCINPTRRKRLRDHYNFLNRRMVHHDVIANQRRLAITVWLSFLSLFSIIVWYWGIGWMLPVLLLSAILINYFGHNYWVEYIGRKIAIRNAEKLEELRKHK